MGVRPDHRLHALLAGLLALAGCIQEGEPPPVGRLHFPTAIGLSDDHRFLYVANSNFDLRYNTSSLHAYSLEVLNDGLDAQACAEDAADRCGVIPVEDARDDLTALDIAPLSGLLVSEVYIGSYASGLGVGRRAGGERLYLSVRSDANLTFVDVGADGRFSCGEGPANAGAPYECAPEFRRGNDETATLRDITLPSDPVGIHVGPLSDIVTGGGTVLPEANYVMLAHRDGRASLFFDEQAGFDVAPRLVHTIGGLPAELVGLTVDPVTKLAWAPSAFVPVVGRVGVAFDGATDEPDRSFLFNAGELAVRGVDTGSASVGDTRAVRFDPRPDVRRAYVLSRLPRAMLTIDVDDSSGRLDVEGIVELGAGPSRFEVEHFTDEGRTLAFISCFDAGDLYVVDVDLQQLVGIVRGLGGPFEIAVDARSVGRRRAYVLDFAQSVIRVLDLEGTLDCLSDPGAVVESCSPRQVGVLGRPVAVRELR